MFPFQEKNVNFLNFTRSVCPLHVTLNYIGCTISFFKTGISFVIRFNCVAPKRSIENMQCVLKCAQRATKITVAINVLRTDTILRDLDTPNAANEQTVTKHKEHCCSC